MRLSDEVVRQARALIASRLGLDFPDGRQADLQRGLVRTQTSSHLSTPENYLAWLASLPDTSPELMRLAGYLTVGETYFFRDRALFEALEQHVLPSLIAARRSDGILRLRLWSAGCATGEEPYSLAILLDRLLPDHSDWALTILATDINPDALEGARRGLYRDWSFRENPRWIRDRYFHPRGREMYEVAPTIRQMVTFAPLNLAGDGYPSVATNTTGMDLILCRNVLMYFTHQAQRATVARLRRALVSDGWLAVSPAEGSAELFRPLVPVNLSGTVLYRKEPTPAAPLPAAWQAEAVLPDSLEPFPVVYTPDDLRIPPLPIKSPSEQQVGAAPDTAADLHAGPSDLERARALADQGKLEEARQLCEAALARDQLDPETHFLFAAICQERGEIPAALEALRRAIYLAPDFAPAHFLLGSLLLREGRRRRGRRCMETVVHLLSSVPPDERVPGSDGLVAGRLLETARAYLEWRS